jgi:hypothetical protein
MHRQFNPLRSVDADLQCTAEVKLELGGRAFLADARALLRQSTLRAAP